MTKTRLLLIVLLAVFSSSEHSPLKAAEPKWRRLTTANFDLLTTEGDRRARAALLHFEQVRSFFLKVGIREPVSASKTLIVAFQSEKEYRPYRPTESAAAYYQRGFDRDYIVMQELSPDFLPAATHEYVHLLVQHSGQELPAWLNEGLADFYSTMTPVGKKVKVGEIIPGRMYSFQESKLLDLSTLFSVDHNSPYYNEKDRTQIFYAQSWALTHMLMMSETYRPKYSEWMNALVSGKSHEEAFQFAYGQTLATVEKNLNSYFRAASYNYMLFDTQLDKSAEQPAIELVSPLESGLALAAILSAGPRDGQARELLQQLEKQFPDDKRVPAALGYVALRKRPNPDEATAREQFARAVAMNNTDVRLLVDYARLLESEPEGEAENGLRERGAARSARSMPVLLKALEMRPSDFETCYELARQFFNANAFSQAIIALQPLKTLSREQGLQVFRLLSYLYVQVNQVADAKASAERLRRISKTPEEISEAEKIFEFVSQEQQPMLARVEQEAADQVEDDGAPESGSAEERPKLRRREALSTEYVEQLAPREPVETVEGVLQNFECLGSQIRLTILANGKKLTLLLADPENVHIRGTGTATIDFTCGPQKSVPVTIEYVSEPDAKLGTAGRIKAIIFASKPAL